MSDPPLTDPAPLRACSACNAPLDERQEMCVECGRPTPAEDNGRLKRALPTLSVAGFAVLFAASAAYALTAGGAGNVRDLGLGKPPAPPAVASAGPTPSNTTPAPAPPAAPSPPAGKAEPAPGPAPEKSASGKPKTAAPAPTPSTGSSGGTNPSTGGSAPRHNGSVPARSHPPRHHGGTKGPAWVAGADAPYSAFVYDPNGTGAGERRSAAPRAIDGRTSTAWSTANHPGGLGKPGVGLVVEAGGYQSYSGLGIQTATPGFSASVYSTDDGSPPSGNPNSSSWRLEATKRSVARQQLVGLKGATAEPRYLLIWITKLPPGKPRAGLSEISLVP
jgi:hypothetical protein